MPCLGSYLRQSKRGRCLLMASAQRFLFRYIVPNITRTLSLGIPLCAPDLRPLPTAGEDRYPHHPKVTRRTPTTGAEYASRMDYFGVRGYAGGVHVIRSSAMGDGGLATFAFAESFSPPNRKIATQFFSKRIVGSAICRLGSVVRKRLSMRAQIVARRYTACSTWEIANPQGNPRRSPNLDEYGV